jgi:hypothetical protein
VIVLGEREDTEMNPERPLRLPREEKDGVSGGIYRYIYPYGSKSVPTSNGVPRDGVMIENLDGGVTVWSGGFGWRKKWWEIGRTI